MISREIKNLETEKMYKAKDTNNTSIRLADIARKANVSRIAVSKALLNTGGNNVRISDATREKILKIAESMNYKPNMAARMLAGKKSNIIGALIDSHAPLCLYECLRMIERKLAEKGYRFMIAQQHNDLGGLMEYIDDFSRYGVEGIISFAHDYPEFNEQLAKVLRSKPDILYIGKPKLKNCNYLEVDVSAGIRKIVDHLVRKGRKRIGIFLADKTTRTMQLRYQGYLEGLKTNGVSLDENLVVFNNKFRHPSMENASEIINILVKQEKADAIISMNDNYAAMIINQLKKSGYDVPGDVAVTGFDNMDFSEFNSPSITTINHCYDALAEKAVNILLEIIMDNKITVNEVIKPELIEREST
jgi:DNA-binding LacI/PurR family transcriptional regulator